MQDIPPYSTCDGHPAMVYGLNLVGLRRHNISKEAIAALDEAFKVIFNSGLSKKHAIEKLEEAKSDIAEIKSLIDFIKKSERGLVRSCRKEK